MSLSLACQLIDFAQRSIKSGQDDDVEEGGTEGAPGYPYTRSGSRTEAEARPGSGRGLDLCSQRPTLEDQGPEEGVVRPPHRPPQSAVGQQSDNGNGDGDEHDDDAA